MGRTRDQSRRCHPWWQQRLGTARGSAAFAVVYSVLGVAWVVVVTPQLLDGSGGWHLPFAVAGAVGWVLLSAAFVAGAVAQRREETVDHLT